MIPQPIYKFMPNHFVVPRPVTPSVHTYVDISPPSSEKRFCQTSAMNQSNLYNDSVITDLTQSSLCSDNLTACDDIDISSSPAPNSKAVVAEGGQPLPLNKNMGIREVISHLVNDEPLTIIPDGLKENTFYIVDYSRNVERKNKIRLLSLLMIVKLERRMDLHQNPSTLVQILRMSSSGKDNTVPPVK